MVPTAPKTLPNQQLLEYELLMCLNVSSDDCSVRLQAGREVGIRRYSVLVESD